MNAQDIALRSWFFSFFNFDLSVYLFVVIGHLRTCRRLHMITKKIAFFSSFRGSTSVGMNFTCACQGNGRERNEWMDFNGEAKGAEPEWRPERKITVRRAVEIPARLPVKKKLSSPVASRRPRLTRPPQRVTHLRMWVDAGGRAAGSAGGRARAFQNRRTLPAGIYATDGRFAGGRPT